MPNLEFDVAHQLVTPLGTLDLNAPAGLRYLIDSEGYRIVPSLRVTAENISQEDGSVLHPRYKTGLVATLKVYYMSTIDADAETPSPGAADQPACGAQLREMHETLTAYLDSIRRNTTASQRLVWTPTGAGDDRMLTEIQTLAWTDPGYELEGALAHVSFAVETPFPYAISATETDTAIADGGTENIENAGSADFSPVVEVAGPFTDFTLTNLDDLDRDGNPRSVVYDSARPGALSVGALSHAELDFFRGTIILNGDETDLVAGLDPLATDFWKLRSWGRDNRITITGADCTVKSNHAWG